MEESQGEGRVEVANAVVNITLIDERKNGE